MAGSKTNYLELALLNHTFGASTFTPPATLYLAAFTVAPTDSTGGTECSGGSYARVAVTNNTTNFPSANPKLNGTSISFPQASAGWGTVVAVAWMDAASAGNMLTYTVLDTSKDITTGDTLNLAAGSLSYSED
jgi:hypothetical protein